MGISNQGPVTGKRKLCFSRFSTAPSPGNSRNRTSPVLGLHFSDYRVNQALGEAVDRVRACEGSYRLIA